MQLKLSFHFTWLICLIFLSSIISAETNMQFDPSGSWKSQTGSLSLISNGETLLFSYSSVFGPTAHICEGAGEAIKSGSGRYEYKDDQGVIAIILTDSSIRMETKNGIASFCGANWPGDLFPKSGFTSPVRCKIQVEKSFFHKTGKSPPVQGKSYVLKGDEVEIVPFSFEGATTWVLARFTGQKSQTIGLIANIDLVRHEKQ